MKNIRPSLRKLFGAVLFAGSVWFPASASACSLSPTSMAFGVYDPIVKNRTTALLSTGHFSISCEQGASVKIAIDEGSHPGPGSTSANPQRNLVSGSWQLPYNLYQDTGHQMLWGGFPGMTYVGTGEPETLTVFGLIPAGQNVSVGAYTDVLTITVTY